VEEIRERWPTVAFRDYALRRLLQRKIAIDEVRQAVFSLRASVLEREPNFYGPTCLVAGWTERDRPLHILFGVGDDILWIMTVYDPSVDAKETFVPPDYTQRRRQRQGHREEADEDLSDL
jgi:hypothetical protein